MGQKDVSKNVRDFLARFIDSVELLEVLLLARAAPEKAWSTKDVARALTLSDESADLRLRQLAGRGLLAADIKGGTFTYSPESADMDKTIDDVAETYAKRRTTVIGLIFSGPSPSVRGFADAFRLRDEDE
ncbi:MAG TPA: hypothetical protein VNP73_05790 [Actinomycetota bacterium]|nr:hypothetical protein [Actinomycetota bacterium]